jgi:hypothetical protein
LHAYVWNETQIARIALIQRMLGGQLLNVAFNACDRRSVFSDAWQRGLMISERIHIHRKVARRAAARDWQRIGEPPAERHGITSQQRYGVRNTWPVQLLIFNVT